MGFCTGNNVLDIGRIAILTDKSSQPVVMPFPRVLDSQSPVVFMILAGNVKGYMDWNCPLAGTATTRMITFFVGNPYKS